MANLLVLYRSIVLKGQGGGSKEKDFRLGDHLSGHNYKSRGDLKDKREGKRKDFGQGFVWGGKERELSFYEGGSLAGLRRYRFEDLSNESDSQRGERREEKGSNPMGGDERRCLNGWPSKMI